MTKHEFVFHRQRSNYSIQRSLLMKTYQDLLTEEKSVLLGKNHKTFEGLELLWMVLLEVFLDQNCLLFCHLFRYPSFLKHLLSWKTNMSWMDMAFLKAKSLNTIRFWYFPIQSFFESNFKRFRVYVFLKSIFVRIIFLPFACCHNFFTCPFSLISHEHFLFMYKFLWGTWMLSRTSSPKHKLALFFR